MSDLDSRVREYLDRVQPEWHTVGVLGPTLDTVLSACASVERCGGQQIAIAELRVRIAETLGVRTGETVDPISQPCNYCNGPIIWARTTGGKSIPLDAVPSAGGNVMLSRGVAGVLGRNAADAARAGGQSLRTHHAVTCPYSAKWRGSR